MVRQQGQIDAGRFLEKDTKKLLDKFEREQKRKIANLMAEIGRKEMKNTKSRLTSRGGLGKHIARSNKLVSKFKMSGNKGDYGTLFFGMEGKIRSREGRLELVDDLAALYAFGKENFAAIGDGDGSHAFVGVDALGARDRFPIPGFIYAGVSPNRRPAFRRRLKIGFVSPDIPEADEFLPQAEENIINKLETEVSAAIVEAWEQSESKRKR